MTTCVQKQKELQIEERQADRQTDRRGESETHQADGGAGEPPGSPVMKTVGNTTQRVHGMF